MPEAGKKVLEVLFEVGYIRIQALHHIQNSKSGRVMQKLGMTYEGRLHKYNLDNQGKFIDCDIYATTKEIE